MQSFAETWTQEGIQEGIQKGMAELTLRQIQHRFGILEAEIQERIRELPVERLKQLGEALLDFKSREDLAAWLREHEVADT